MGTVHSADFANRVWHSAMWRCQDIQPSIW